MTQYFITQKIKEILWCVFIDPKFTCWFLFPNTNNLRRCTITDRRIIVVCFVIVKNRMETSLKCFPSRLNIFFQLHIFPIILQRKETSWQSRREVTKKEHVHCFQFVQWVLWLRFLRVVHCVFVPNAREKILKRVWETPRICTENNKSEIYKEFSLCFKSRLDERRNSKKNTLTRSGCHWTTLSIHKRNFWISWKK
jgi:hypothetical protein